MPGPSRSPPCGPGGARPASTGSAEGPGHGGGAVGAPERVEGALAPVGHGDLVAGPAGGSRRSGDGARRLGRGRGATELVGRGDDSHGCHRGRCGGRYGGAHVLPPTGAAGGAGVEPGPGALRGAARRVAGRSSRRRRPGVRAGSAGRPDRRHLAGGGHDRRRPEGGQRRGPGGGGDARPAPRPRPRHVPAGLRRGQQRGPVVRPPRAVGPAPRSRASGRGGARHGRPTAP